MATEEILDSNDLSRDLEMASEIDSTNIPKMHMKTYMGKSPMQAFSI